MIKADNPLQHEIDAMMGASGLDINQAKTATYYAATTHMLDTLEKMPILVFLGKAGTGKSNAMEQLGKLVHNPVRETGKSTPPALRDQMKKNGGYKTIFIEEADTVDEEIISNRYSRQSANQTVKRASYGGTWTPDAVDTFGATVLHKRVPFKDVAVKSRSIIIRTVRRVGNYSIAEIMNSNIADVAARTKQNIPQFESSDRVTDTWKPLMLIAMALNDEEWLSYAKEQIAIGTKEFLAGHGYEPEEALIRTLQALFKLRGPVMEEKPVLISDVRDALKTEFGITLFGYQIEQMCTQLGFKVTKPHGYPTVQPDKELLTKLVNDLNACE